MSRSARRRRAVAEPRSTASIAMMISLVACDDGQNRDRLSGPSDRLVFAVLPRDDQGQ
jgi:hypothetical protein